MKYTVVWRPSAENKLAEIWMTSTDQSAVTTAADAIDTLLAASPLSVGESRWRDGVRLFTVTPLSVYYDVSPADCCVEVWAVWYTGS